MSIRHNEELSWVKEPFLHKWHNSRLVRYTATFQAKPNETSIYYRAQKPFLWFYLLGVQPACKHSSNVSGLDSWLLLIIWPNKTEKLFSLTKVATFRAYPNSRRDTWVGGVSWLFGEVAIKPEQTYQHNAHLMFSRADVKVVMTWNAEDKTKESTVQRITSELRVHLNRITSLRQIFA